MRYLKSQQLSLKTLTNFHFNYVKCTFKYSLKMNFSKMKIKDFINFDNVDDILDTCNTQSIKGLTSDVNHLTNFLAFFIFDEIKREYNPLSLIYIESGCYFTLKVMFIFFNCILSIDDTCFDIAFLDSLYSNDIQTCFALNQIILSLSIITMILCF